MYGDVKQQLADTLAEIEGAGLYKREREIDHAAGRAYLHDGR